NRRYALEVKSRPRLRGRPGVVGDGTVGRFHAVKQGDLGLPLGDKINVRYADGRRAQRREAEGAHVKLQGREATFDAIIEPKRKNASIGAIVLERLDLLVDCQHQRLIPHDPRGPIYEIE